MTRRAQPGNRERDAVLAFWDVLLPGGAGFPCASAAITRLDDGFAQLSTADRSWLVDHAPAIADRPRPAREDAMRDLAHNEPGPFARVLAALYAAYYTSAAVHAVVQKLAEAGPREASPSFDATLLRQVITTQAGKRQI